MATSFLVELVLSGHDVFLLEDEETHGWGVEPVVGHGTGMGNGYGAGDGLGGCGDSEEDFAAGNGIGDGYGGGRGKGSGLGLLAHIKKNEYGYRIPR